MKTVPEQLQYLEQQMRDSAVGISNLYSKMKEIDNVSANKALSGITQYLNEKNNVEELAELAENEENFNTYGIITVDQYVRQKQYIKNKYSK